MEPFYFPDHAHSPQRGSLLPPPYAFPLPTGPSALYSHAAAPTTTANAPDSTPVTHNGHHLVSSPPTSSVVASPGSANIAAALSMATIFPVDTRLLLSSNSMFALGHRRRASVSRSRTGCWTCRLRRKKCSEEKPACAACLRLKLACDGYGERPDFMKTAEAMGRKRDDIRRSIRAFKNHHAAGSVAADDSDADADADTGTGSVSGSISSSVSGFVPDDSHISVPVPVPAVPHGVREASSTVTSSPAVNGESGFRSQRRHLTHLPKFLDIDLPTLDIHSPACPLPLLSHYIHEVPSNLFTPAVDRASQVLLVVVYFRLAVRLLHPALFLEPDDRIDFKLLLYDASIANPYIWRSVCALASVYTSVVLCGSPASSDTSCVSPAKAQFASDANSFLSAPTNASLPEDELECAMLLGWNLYTLQRLVGPNDTATLHTLLKLTSRFGLLSSTTRQSPLLRVLAAYTMHADIIHAANSGARPVLSATYADMLSSHFRGTAIFRNAATGVPIATPLLLILSRILDFEQDIDDGGDTTNFVLGLEAVSCSLDTFLIDADAPPNATTMRCSDLFRLSIRAYLPCFVSRARTDGPTTYIVARDSPSVRETILAFCKLLAADFLALQHSTSQLSQPDMVFQDSIAGQELERCILWSLTFIGSITPPELHSLYGPCRDIIQRVFETCVSLGSFGNWSLAWRIVCTCWRSDLWADGKSFRDVLREEACGNVVM
ncbi:hypothetical protein V1524DRAFT_415920 [Lipomyces starkeyi]